METEILKARIIDTMEICEKTNRPKFLGFLSKEESVLAERILNSINSDFTLFGGYKSAERVMLGCFPEWDNEKNFPISAVTFYYRKTDVLGHRDFLGSLMALGITRMSVGDILAEEGRAVVFVTSDILGFVLSQVEKIGKVGVEVKEGYDEPLPQKNKLSSFDCTVASERLDCVIAAVCNISRGTAVSKIEEGTVSVNSVVCEKPTKTVASGDAVTVRGRGKFLIESLELKTRKNRIVLKYQKYI